MFKNMTEKSVILAPFNSTKSNIESLEPFSETIKDLLQSNSCIKFAARVRDINKQYEQNNNAELDNGVYHKLEEEEDKKNADKKGLNSSDDSLQSSFNKESSLKSDEDDEAERIKYQERKKKQELKKRKKDQTELEKLESLI